MSVVKFEFVESVDSVVVSSNNKLLVRSTASAGHFLLICDTTDRELI